MVKIKHKRIKVLFVAFQSGNNANGGIASLNELINSLDNNFKVFLFTQRNTDISRQWKSKYNTKILLQQYWPSFIYTAFFNFRVLLFCWANGIKKIYCNDIDATIHSGLAAKVISSGVIFSIRGVKERSDSYGLKWKIAKNLTKTFIVLSNEMKSQLMKKLNIDEGRMRVVYSIVNHSFYRQLSNATINDFMEINGISNNKIHLGIPAAVYPLKQQLEFIQYSCKHILSKLSNVHFHFLGDTLDTKYFDLCKKAVREAGLDEVVTFHGYSEKMIEWYNIFSVTVITSSREGLSRAMIESLSCGTPVISFDVCSAKEILVDNKCGVVVGQLDFMEMSKEIVQYILTENNEMSKNAVSTSQRLFSKNINSPIFAKILIES